MYSMYLIFLQMWPNAIFYSQLKSSPYNSCGEAINYFGNIEQTGNELANGLVLPEIIFSNRNLLYSEHNDLKKMRLVRYCHKVSKVQLKYP